MRDKLVELGTFATDLGAALVASRS